MWDKKFNDLKKLLRYLEQTETYNYFKESKNIKNEEGEYSKALSEKYRIYKEIVDFDKMIMYEEDDDFSFPRITGYTKLQLLKKEYNEFLEKKKKVFNLISFSSKYENFFYVHNILKNNLNFMNFKLECIRELKEIFKSCDEAVIFKVIQIVEEWYKDEKWFSEPTTNKFMYYGATLYYALRRSNFFSTYDLRGEKFYDEDLKIEIEEWNHKEELENTWFKCIKKIGIVLYKDFI